MTPQRERVSLQRAVAFFALVPICAGLAGALWGVGVFDDLIAHGPETESHGRYLSGLLLGIGLAFWSTVPSIERQGQLFRTLTAIVVLGGLVRLVYALATGSPGPSMTFALVMELVVTPALAWWRERVERRLRQAAEDGPGDDWP